MKQVFNYYADSHKHNWNSNNQYLGNFENKTIENPSNYSENNNNLNGVRFVDSLTSKK